MSQSSRATPAQLFRPVDPSYAWPVTTLAPQPPQPQPPRHHRHQSRRWAAPTIIGLGAFALGGVVGQFGGGDGSAAGTTARPLPAVTVTRTVTATVPAPAKAAVATRPATFMQGDGTYVVGTDLQPGRYKSAAPASGNCYWARLKDTSGGFEAIIANDNSSGQSVVTIKKSDRAFQTGGCSDWRKIG